MNETNQTKVITFNALGKYENLRPTVTPFKASYATMKEMQQLGKLIPGQLYRITDYVTTVNSLTVTNARSAGHQFDILVVAINETTLSEEAWAVPHDGDTYFKDSRLEAWQLKYRLDNEDVTESGKGTITWMKDEWGNEAAYDFKNIQQKRWKVTDELGRSSIDGKYLGVLNNLPEKLSIEDESDFIWAYLYSVYNYAGGTQDTTDHSLTGNVYEMVANFTVDSNNAFVWEDDSYEAYKSTFYGSVRNCSFFGNIQNSIISGQLNNLLINAGNGASGTINGLYTLGKIDGKTITVPTNAAYPTYAAMTTEGQMKTWNPADSLNPIESLGAYDISAAHASGGVLATYADLTAALGTNGANIPEGIRKGGMSVKFVLSSDNKYVQYRLTADEFSTTEGDWQGVDDIPTAGSDNLVKSGGVYLKINQEKQRAESVEQNLQGNIDVIKEETLEENREMVNSIMQNYAPVEIIGDVNNAPDEEDLTSVNVEGTDVLKFKDKVYNPLVYSGLGRKILRKNIVDGVNTLTQDMFYKDGDNNTRVPNTNTIYVIQYDFTLGEDITVPANCVLEFDGGSLRNGTIIGNNCNLSGNLNYNIFNDCVIKDFRLSYIDVRWFGASESTKTTKIPSADYFQRAYSNALYYHDGVPLVIKGWFYIEKTVNVNTSFAIHGFNAIASDIAPVNIEQKIPSVIEVAPNITAFNVVGRPYAEGSGTKVSFIDIRDVYLISSGLSSIFADISASGAPSMPGIIFHVEAYHFDRVFNFRRTQEKDTVYAVLSVRSCKMANNNASFYSYYDGTGVILCQLHIVDSDLEAGGRVYLSNVWGSHIIDNCMLEGQRNTIYFNGRAMLTVTNNYFEANSGVINIVASKGLYWSRNYSNGTAANCIVVGGKILKYEDSNFSNYQNLIIRNETVIEDVNFISKTCPYNYVFREYENTRYGERIAKINFKTLPTIQHKTPAISPTDFSILRSNHYEKSSCGMVYIDELNKEVPLLTLTSATNYYIHATGLQLEAGDIIVLTFYQIGSVNTALFVDRYHTNIIGRVSNYNGFTIYCIKLEEGDYDYDQLHLGFLSSNGGKVSNAILSVIPKNNTTTKLVECIKIYDDCPLAPVSGTFANRPRFDTTLYDVKNDGVGFKYFCTDKQTAEGATDGIEIIYKGDNVWVDSLGRVVS